MTYMKARALGPGERGAAGGARAMQHELQKYDGDSCRATKPECVCKNFHELPQWEAVPMPTAVGPEAEFKTQVSRQVFYYEVLNVLNISSN